MSDRTSNIIIGVLGVIIIVCSILLIIQNKNNKTEEGSSNEGNDTSQSEIYKSDDTSELCFKRLNDHSFEVPDFDLKDYDVSDEKNHIGSLITREAIIVFQSAVPTSRREEIVHEIGGKIILNNSVIDELNVLLPCRFGSFESIQKYLDELNIKYTEIIETYPNSILEVEPD